MKVTQKLTILSIAAAIALPACQQIPAAPNAAAKAQSVPAPLVNGHTHMSDASVIPSLGAPKVHTTNEHGGTTYGLGSSVYSLIGSSSLHSDGLSSHLESRLSGAGIDGVQVLAVDDMVIVAAESRKPTASRYDPMQQKVLSNTGGQSARGPEPGKPIGTLGTGQTVGDDNLDEAENQIKQFLGPNVKVVKVAGQQAVKAINRIRANRTDPYASPQAVSNNIETLLRMAANNRK
jgi:hypothetical protein